MRRDKLPYSGRDVEELPPATTLPYDEQVLWRLRVDTCARLSNDFVSSKGQPRTPPSDLRGLFNAHDLGRLRTARYD